ncbi:hypothetical protein [Campylobacter insulaenigrae]|uniref:hypothetical protein n=1 Tax=Campylobacter insulaenigrae TaxID=260714 RepID=UPI002153897A|nr:hypothetical protein [Campylobacter insulaenigrae]MCR6580350.1 hypothetical protein [Campylobacter insulaenigrae]
MKEMDYCNFLEEADCLIEKYEEEEKELTEEVFLNFLKEMIQKYNIDTKCDYFKFKKNFLFVAKDKRCYTIIIFDEDRVRRINFSGYSFETKEEGQKYFEENFKEYEKVE